jgi:hypothetical protein
MASLNAGNAAASLSLVHQCLKTYGFHTDALSRCSPAASEHLSKLHLALQTLCQEAPRYAADGARVACPSAHSLVAFPDSVMLDGSQARVDSAAQASNAPDISAGCSTLHGLPGKDAHGLLHNNVTGGLSDGACERPLSVATGSAAPCVVASADASSSGGVAHSCEHHYPSGSGKAPVGQATARVSSPSECGQRGSSRHSRRVDGVLLRYEESSVPCSVHELVARLQAHLAGQGHSISAVMEMLRMSMMEIFMAVCVLPPGNNMVPTPGTCAGPFLSCFVSSW